MKSLRQVVRAHNPFSREVSSPADQVILLDNLAFRDPRDGRWQAEFVSAYFRRDSGDKVSDTVSRIAEILGLAKNDKARRTIEDRVQPFVDIIKPGETADIRFGGQTTLKLGPAGKNGIASDLLKLPDDKRFKEDQFVISDAVFTKGDRRKVTMRTDFAEPTGWGVISDIDDTIKITLTRSRFGLLQSTFVDDPTPTQGMPEFYDRLQKTLEPTWVYLSASPYNLYAFIHSFVTKYYPHGMIILRDMSWMDLSSFIGSLTFKVQTYKQDRIEKLHGWLPGRNWICIGDSTQKDPEAYGAMYRAHPDWIRAIYIRLVTGVSEKDEEELNSTERFEKAFEGVPSYIWKTFHDPSEIDSEIARLKRDGLDEIPGVNLGPVNHGPVAGTLAELAVSLPHSNHSEHTHGHRRKRRSHRSNGSHRHRKSESGHHRRRDSSSSSSSSN